MTTQYFPSPFTLFDRPFLKKLESTFWNYNQSKFSYPELSHRSQHYAEVNLKSQELIATYFSVPNNYHVIYLASEAGYSAIPFNLITITNSRAIYIVNDEES
jgi:phosphoserine aminotransferase